LLSRKLQEDGLPPAEAHHGAELEIRAQIARGLADLAGFRARAQTRTGHPEAAIDDIARFVCEFYTQHDYHTLESDRVAEPREPFPGGSKNQRAY
jgi:hypothetical protein